LKRGTTLEQEPAAKRFFEEIELFLGKQSE
jgi:hypothetical protein